MALKKTKKEQLFSPKFHPYGLALKKFFEGLKEENFRPYEILAFEQKSLFKDNKTEYIMKSQIEHLFTMHSLLFNKNYDYNPFSHQKNEEEVENYEFLESRFDYKSESTRSKSWILFLKRFAKEFNIDYNQVLFPSHGSYEAYEMPHEAMHIKNLQYPNRTLNILHVALENTAPIPTINSLIELGLDYKSSYSIFFSQNTFIDGAIKKCMETTPFIKFLKEDNYPERIKLMLFENLLQHDINLINGSYHEFDFSGKEYKYEDFYSLFTKMDISTKNKYGSALYNVIQQNKENNISIIKNEKRNMPENTLNEFLYNNCSFVQSKMQKEIIFDNITTIKPTSKSQRRL